MKLRQLRIHNFRSIIDADIEINDYTMIVGANNAGKSNLLAAIRAFYEDIKYSNEDFPKIGATSEESWMELVFDLTPNEWDGLAEKYKEGASEPRLTVRRYFSSKERVKANQSNIYGIVKGEPDKELFYGAKNIGTAKIGHVIYIPALTTAADQMKTSGPSPLRDMLNLMLKRVVSDSPAYKQIEESFAQLNIEAQGDTGFLAPIARPINEAIKDWGVRFDMAVNTVSTDDITKNLVKHAFADAMLGDAAFSLDRYGHGFQRAFIYELIKLASTFSDRRTSEKKEFDPDFTLILFEEPEAFLHPAQQDNMAYHLRNIAAGGNQQVIVTSHSPIFVGKVADDLCQIVRARRVNGLTSLGQIKRQAVKDVFADGLDFKNCLQSFVADVSIGEEKKAKAKELLKNTTSDEEIAEDEERFRYQLWLDSDRASMFFADRVLLVEGATERALFGWFLARDWHDLNRHRVAVIDVMGKFNFHRYMTLLEKFGIPYGLILDDDNNKNHHLAVNEMLKNRSGSHQLAPAVLVTNCMEAFLEKPLPKRDDMKPVQMLKELEAKAIPAEKLTALRNMFCGALAI